jgi:hypothetical protein
MDIADASGLVAEVTAAAPFVDVRTYPFHATLALPDWPLTWDAMRNNPGMGALLQQCTEDELAIVKKGVLDHFRELAGGDDRPLMLESVCNILVARRA